MNAWRPNHWTAREFPNIFQANKFYSDSPTPTLSPHSSIEYTMHVVHFWVPQGLRVVHCWGWSHRKPVTELDPDLVMVIVC